MIHLSSNSEQDNIWTFNQYHITYNIWLNKDHESTYCLNLYMLKMNKHCIYLLAESIIYDILTSFYNLYCVVVDIQEMEHLQLYLQPQRLSCQHHNLLSSSLSSLGRGSVRHPSSLSILLSLSSFLFPTKQSQNNQSTLQHH